MVVFNLNIRKKIIKKLHNNPYKLISVITGAGVTAITDMLSVPGASKTVLEVIVPYSKSALEFYKNAPIINHVSVKESQELALLAYRRGKNYIKNNEDYIAISCTAAISTIPQRKGEDRAHISWTNGKEIKSVSIYLSKMFRSRISQERLISDLIINSIAESFGIDLKLDLDLYDDEKIIINR